MRRLRREAELLEGELARRSAELTSEFARRYRGLAGSHPAVAHLAELQEQVKRLADLPSGNAGVDDRKGSGADRA